MMAGMKLLDRKVICADEFYAMVDQQLGRLGKQVGKVFAKPITPESGIARSKKHALNSIKIAARQEFRIDFGSIIRHANDSRRSYQNIQRQRIDFVCAFNKMRGRVDVCAGVRAKMQKGNVCR